MNADPTILDRARSLAAALWERTTRLSRMTRLLLLGLVALTITLFAALSALSPDPTGRELTLTQLDQMNKSKRVIDADVYDEDHLIQVTIGVGEGIVEPGRYHVYLPANDSTSTAVIAALQKSGTWVTIFPQTGKATVRLLTTAVLPILILANLFALFFSARSGALSDIESFGQLEKAGTVGGTVSFKDVAGVEEAQEELREVVDYLRNPERYAAVGAVPPKGVLLFGPPGCGKTLLARAVAGEAGVPFFSVAAAEFVESLVGVGAARVRDLFSRVRSLAPAIVFIDELDAAGRRRGTGGGGGEERDTTLNQLLVEMDGFDVSQGIVVIAATNRPDILDPALLRPGRFDRHVVIDRPDVERREQILRLHAARRPIASDVDFGLLARQTPGFSGADLANVLNEAALLTIRSGSPIIDAATLSEAVERVLGGPQRRGHLLTEEERRRVACHEAGHAVAAALLGQAEKVHRVSIVARGRTLGSAGLERDDAEAIRTVSQMRARIAIALAGRAAEELAFGEASTGAADDLQHATRLAREMAGRHGLAPELGLLAYEGGGLEDDPTLGIASEASWAALDDAARKILDEAHDSAAALLQDGTEHFETLTATLLEVEQLEGAPLLSLLPDPLPDPRVRQLLGTGAASAARRAKSKTNGGAKRA